MLGELLDERLISFQLTKDAGPAKFLQATMLIMNHYLFKDTSTHLLLTSVIGPFISNLFWGHDNVG